MMTTRNASVMTVFEYVHATEFSKTPRPSAASTVRGMFSIRPITAAANVRKSSEFPPPVTDVKDENPTIGTRSNAAAADKKAAIDHTARWR